MCVQLYQQQAAKKARYRRPGSELRPRTQRLLSENRVGDFRFCWRYVLEERLMFNANLLFSWIP